MNEKNRRVGGTLLVAGFAALLLLPWPLWLLLRGSLDTTNYENRALAGYPSGVSVEAWPSAFEDYWEDHAPFRNQLMTLRAQLNWRLFGAVDSADVLLGREGWLFLRDVSDSRSISDYQGLTVCTPEEEARFLAVLGELSAALARRGSRLVILCAPAKEGVYSRYMPDTIPVVARPTRVQALMASLEAAGLCVVWPQQALTDAAETMQVYYKYDTHWNEVGGYLAARQALQALGRADDAQSLPEVTAAEGVSAPTDLANMCALWSLCTDDVYLLPAAQAAAVTEQNAGETVVRYAGGGAGSLLLVRDSFGAALAPWLAAGFAKTLSVHNNALQNETLNANLPAVPDVVVLECGERFADNYLAQAEKLLAWLEQLP